MNWKITIIPIVISRQLLLIRDYQKKKKNAMYANSIEYIQCRFIRLNISNLENNSIQIHR